MVTQPANNRLKGTTVQLAGETRCGGWARVTCLHRLVVVWGYRWVGFAGRAAPRASLQRVGPQNRFCGPRDHSIHQLARG
eukprot:COSAG06_NODE_32_length_31260_cov_54.706973_19_plen_80_part_00